MSAPLLGHLERKRRALSGAHPARYAAPPPAPLGTTTHTRALVAVGPARTMIRARR